MTGIESAIGGESRIAVRLKSIQWATHDINVYELATIDGAPLPAAAPGAHIDLALPPGDVRQYSLLHPERSGASYWIGVKRETEGRGGSAWLHDQARVGARMTISLPRNHFPLDESALHSVLVAGGIGITPILAMARRMDALGRSWELHYACRSRADAAFLDELAGFGEQVRLRCDDEHPGSFLDIAAIVRTAAPGTHFYCCGPKPMLAGFEAAMADIPAERVHLEYFAPKDEAATGGGFTIELIRSGREIFVPAGKSILDVVQEAGIRVAHSCTEGVCGSCETGVLRGRPDHRDSVLSPGERARGDVMMICCSGSLDDRLALDL